MHSKVQAQYMVVPLYNYLSSDWVYSIYGMPRLPVTALLLRSVWNVTTSCMLHHLLFETQCVLQYDG